MLIMYEYEIQYERKKIINNKSTSEIRRRACKQSFKLVTSSWNPILAKVGWLFVRHYQLPKWYNKFSSEEAPSTNKTVASVLFEPFLQFQIVFSSCEN